MNDLLSYYTHVVSLKNTVLLTFKQERNWTNNTISQFIFLLLNYQFAIKIVAKFLTAIILDLKLEIYKFTNAFISHMKVIIEMINNSIALQFYILIL